MVKDHKVRKVQGMLLDRQGVEKMAAKPSDGVAQTLSEIKTRVDKEMQEVVAESPRELTSERDIVRKQESELGNLAADAIRHAAGADIAFINGGSLRSNLPKGKVTDTYDAIMSGLDKLQAEYTANNAATEISA